MRELLFGKEVAQLQRTLGTRIGTTKRMNLYACEYTARELLAECSMNADFSDTKVAFAIVDCGKIILILNELCSFRLFPF